MHKAVLYVRKNVSYLKKKLRMSLKQKITHMNFFAWLFVSCVLFESIEGDSKELKFHKKEKKKKKKQCT